MTNRRYRITLYKTNGLRSQPIYVDSYTIAEGGFALITKSANTVLILTLVHGESFLITDTEVAPKTQEA
jgi:hypothetical protein